VLGDMLELGPYEERAHNMVGMRAAQVADTLITLGPRGHMYAQAAQRAGMQSSHIFEFETRSDVESWLGDNLSETDVVLIKGSHGLRMDLIVGALEQGS
jgi:UDP-N-acetylmuramoyl-tripeptide--D-alanyl-D-alanine ligase